MTITKFHSLPDGREISYTIHQSVTANRTVYEVNGNYFEFALSAEQTLVNLPTPKMLTEMYRFSPDDPSDEASSLSIPIVISVWGEETFVID